MMFFPVGGLPLPPAKPQTPSDDKHIKKGEPVIIPHRPSLSSEGQPKMDTIIHKDTVVPLAVFKQYALFKDHFKTSGVMGAEADLAHWFNILMEMYTDPRRAFFNWERLHTVLDDLRILADAEEYSRRNIFVAAWFVECCMGPDLTTGAMDDTIARSVQVWIECSNHFRVSNSLQGSVAKLIEEAASGEGCTGKGAKLLYDALRVWWAAPRQTFVKQAMAMEEQYVRNQGIPEENYLKWRIKQISYLIAQPHIYKTPEMRKAGDTFADLNLEDELRTLKEYEKANAGYV